MSALRELCTLLAENSELSSEGLSVILSQCPPPALLVNGAARLTQRHLRAVLEVARFIAYTAGVDIRLDLLSVVLEFLRAIPQFSINGSWPLECRAHTVSSFFPELLVALVKITEESPAASQAVSGVVAGVIRKITVATEGEGTVAISPGIKAFLLALSQNCPPFHVSDAEKVTECLLEHWIVPLQTVDIPLASPDGSDWSSSVTQQQHAFFSYGHASYTLDTSAIQGIEVVANSKTVNGTGLLLSNENHVLDSASQNSTRSTTPIFTPLSSPSKFSEAKSLATTIKFSETAGTSRAGTPDCFLQFENRVLGSRLLSGLETRSLHSSERQEIAFRLVAQIFEKVDAGRVVSDLYVDQLRTATLKHLKALLPLLKVRKQDWSIDGADLKTIVHMRLQTSHAAAILQIKCLLISESDGKLSRGALQEIFPLLMDAAEACIGSPWRKLKSCEVLCANLLTGVAQVAAVHGIQVQKAVLLRYKTLILVTCAQAEAWGIIQGPIYESILRTSCSLLEAGWNDRSTVESFLLSLATYVRDQAELGENDKQVVRTQLNLTSFLADLVVLLNKPEIVEMILPLFIESLEQGNASTPSLLRIKLLGAVVTLASLGHEKSYREVVVMLTQSYLDKLSSTGSTHSRILPPEGATEQSDSLPSAFLQMACRLREGKLRCDYQQRLLALCSDVGLIAEAKNGRSGADLLGPLLPSLAEMCSEFDPTQDVDSSLLKLFRNLWFYIALFGLAPPVQQGPQSSKQSLNQTGNKSQVSTTVMTLQAVGGPYLWRMEWSAAAVKITQGTPPLVVSSMKWLEDELELNALHNPGSRRGSSNEKAAVAQRAALSAALGNRVDVSSMSMISGVKATYLLAVSFLEILRFSHHGGVLRSSESNKKCTSALSCVFKYLETPDLLPTVHQCLAAIVHQAFNAALLWLRERNSATGEQADEREEVLEAHTLFLIRTVTHRDEKVREIADGLLSQLRTLFPQVLWNSRCLGELLQIVADHSPASSAESSRVICNQRAREWIGHGLLQAPCTMQGLLQEQFRKLSTWQKASSTSDLLSLLSDIRLDPMKVHGSYGIATIPAVISASAAAAGTNPQVSEIASLDILSIGIISANIKSNYEGEIVGMKRLYAGIGGLNISSPLPSKGGFSKQVDGTWKVGHEKMDGTNQGQCLDTTFDDLLTTRFVQLLQQFVITAERGLTVDGVAFREASLRGASLLLSNAERADRMLATGFSQLLRLLCWCPAYIFTPEVLETGVFIWTWLLSAAPHLGPRVLAELVDAWLWTIDAEKGLFASGVKNSGPVAKLRPQLTSGDPGSVTDNDPVVGILAHRIWLGFLLDRFEVVRHASGDQLLLIGRLLQGSVKAPHHFSSHPAATGTFFSLMSFGVKFCASQVKMGSGYRNTGVDLLLNRIYRTALCWFAVEPGWFDATMGTMLAESQAVATFVHQLTADLSETDVVEENKHWQDSFTANGTPATTQMQFGDPFGSDKAHSREKRKQLLLMLCQHEADRLDTWAHPLKETMTLRLKISPTSDRWAEYAKVAWSIDPRICLSLVARFPGVALLKTEVTAMVQGHLCDLYGIPEALPYFVTPKAVDEDSPVLQHLPHWAPCSITRALEFLTPSYKGHHRVMAYVLRVMETYPPERVTFFMPQLVQSLRYDQGGLVEGYLMVAARRSNLFAHILIWQLQGEEPPSSDDAGKESVVAKGNLYEIVPRVKQRIIDSFTPEAFDVFVREFHFFDKVTSISGVLYPLPKEERRAGIRRELEKIKVEGQDLYLPTAPNKLVRGIELDSGIPLQSAAKVPIMITFDVVDKDGDCNDVKLQACIFKVGDDCRQDVLALQVIALLRDIFEAVGINLYLFPYGVLPTGYGRGIIEVVPNTRSRNQMGETTDGGLKEIFQQDYGPVGSPKFEKARDNFVVSSAGYAVASLLLQPKDRHNGNLLFDKDGRLVHIDFGFILETSPGGNMRFESAQFKLSHEMTQLLDPSGVMKSETWHRFVSLCIKGYLCARQHMDGIVNTVSLMKDSGLPCFSRGDPIGNLRKRFHPEMSEREAANFMSRTCADAYNKWTTAGYDLIQYLQQGIEK